MVDVSIEVLRKILVENCMLKVDVQAITEDTPLFGPGGVGLDSLDALQIVMVVEKNYGVTIGDAATAQEALQSLGVLRDWILRKRVAAAS